MAPASVARPGKGQWGSSPDRHSSRDTRTGGLSGASPSCTHTLGAPPSQGNPKPQASWTHDGHALDSQRVSVHTGDKDSILFIRSSQRSDSGRYELTVRLDNLEARAAIDILVTGTGPGGRVPHQGPREPHLPPPEQTLGQPDQGERWERGLG